MGSSDPFVHLPSQWTVKRDEGAIVVDKFADVAPAFLRTRGDQSYRDMAVKQVYGSPTAFQALSTAVNTVGSLGKRLFAKSRVRFANLLIFKLGLGANPVRA